VQADTGYPLLLRYAQKLHEPSLHVELSWRATKNQKIRLKSAEQFHASQHHKVTHQSPKKSAPAQPQKSQSKL